MPSEEIEKFRIIETKKTYRPTIRDWLIGGFKQATWDQVRIFAFSFLTPGDELQTALKSYREWEEAGLQPWEVTNTPSGPLQDDLLLGAAQYRTYLDHLSWVGSIVPPMDETETIAWDNLSNHYLLSPFRDDKVSGGFVTITGKPRMGKTGICCDLDEIWMVEYPETEILSNVPLEKAVPGVVPTSTTTALMHGVARALKAGRRWRWDFDEPSLSGWFKPDAQTSKAKNLERFARIVPKLGGSLVYIEQRQEGVPTILQDFSKNHIIATNPGSAIFDYARERVSVRSIPKPKRVKYISGETGYFDLEDAFDWDGLFRALRYNPELLMIEDAEPSTQGERIEHFLSKLDEKVAKEYAPVRCRFCGESWVPKSGGPPARCPRCDKRDPTGALKETQAEKPVSP